MTSRDFCYWVQGWLELAEPKEVTAKQLDLIKRHLNLVFYHEIDPSFGDDHKALTAIHDGQATDQEYPKDDPRSILTRKATPEEIEKGIEEVQKAILKSRKTTPDIRGGYHTLCPHCSPKINC